MDNTAVFYTVNMGSIPVGRTSYSGFGEMDIIFVFETKVMGSIPVSPAKQRLTTVIIENTIESCLINERKT
jgi:hypothetical protein